MFRHTGMRWGFVPDRHPRDPKPPQGLSGSHPWPVTLLYFTCHCPACMYVGAGAEAGRDRGPGHGRDRPGSGPAELREICSVQKPKAPYPEP